MWSGNVHRAYAAGRKITAEDKRDADQKSQATAAELDSGLRRSQQSVSAVHFFGANRAPLEFRKRRSQQTCVGREWFQLPVLQMGRDKKKFSRRKLCPGTAEISGQTTNDRELPKRRCFAGSIKIPFSDFE